MTDFFLCDRSRRWQIKTEQRFTLDESFFFDRIDNIYLKHPISETERKTFQKRRQ